MQQMNSTTGYMVDASVTTQNDTDFLSVPVNLKSTIIGKHHGTRKEN